MEAHTQTQASAVEYAKLVLNDEVNARNIGDYSEGIDELAALIKAKGLLQPIIVRKAKGGKFEIHAGKRRYLAIGALIKAGDWPKDQPVPVNVRDEDDESALETSLIENIARRPMHPVDEFETFAKLHSTGSTLEAIAQRYGITTLVVRQRLTLGGMAPEIRDAWRKGEIDADIAIEFAACSDLKEQAATFKRMRKQNGGRFWAGDVRRRFVKDRPNLTDKRVLFVGVERYKAAGGKVVETLFGGDGYLEDGKLFDKLLKQRIKERCEDLVVAGWAWAQSVDGLGHVHHSWGRLEARKKYAGEEKARQTELQEKIADLRGVDRDDRGGDDNDALQLLEYEFHDIEQAATQRGFTPEQRAKSGCILHIDRHSCRVDFGVVRNKSQSQIDKVKEAKRKARDAGASKEEVEAVVSADISNALLEDITSTQTKALAEALAQCPALAVRIAAAALAPLRGYAASPVKLNPDGLLKHAHFDPEDDDAGGDTEEVSGFGAAFEATDEKQAAKALAVNLGRALDVRRMRFNAPAPDEIDGLVAAFPGDIYLEAIRKAFNPEDFFARASVRVAEAAIAEMAAFDRAELEQSLPKKKADLAAMAAAKAVRLGWLPEVLRHPQYSLKGGLKGKSKKK